MLKKNHYALCGIMASVCFVFSCSRASLDDNPDIRPYLYLAESKLTFDGLMKQLPPSIVVEQKHLPIQRAIPSYPGNVYFLLDSTNRVYVSYIKIRQNGNMWSYGGTFFFDSDGYCVAVQYESWTRSRSPSVPRHILSRQALGIGGNPDNIISDHDETAAP